MKLHFTKMHGAGNDFVVVDAVRAATQINEDQIRKIADRQTGVGCDQVLLIEPPKRPDADFEYRIFNADGSPGPCDSSMASCSGWPSSLGSSAMGGNSGAVAMIVSFPSSAIDVGDSTSISTLSDAWGALVD